MIQLDRTKLVLHQINFKVERFIASYWLRVTAFRERHHIPLKVERVDSRLGGGCESKPDTFSWDEEDDLDLEGGEGLGHGRVGDVDIIESTSAGGGKLGSDGSSEMAGGLGRGTADESGSVDGGSGGDVGDDGLNEGDTEYGSGEKNLSNEGDGKLVGEVSNSGAKTDHFPSTLKSDRILKTRELGAVGDYLSREQLDRPIRLSFCQTCLKRLSQIQRTLPVNLRDNLSLRDQIEFVVVDFGTPGLYEWVYQNFIPYLRTGYLRYIRTTQLPTWHASVAKNTSHRFSRGRILVNLDGDNYTGWRGAEHILRVFQKYGQHTVFHQWSGISKDGTYGRISYSRETFFQLGGYDESFYPMGYQDHDIIMRYHLLESGKYLTYEALPPTQCRKNRLKYSRAIPNDKTKSLVNTKYSRKMDWGTMNQLNQRKSHQNIMRRQYQVNDHLEYIGVRIS